MEREGDTMHIVIVGAGSIGLLIGTYLAEAGITVTYLVRREEQADLLREQGIARKTPDGRVDEFPVFATAQLDDLPTDVLWIVAAKYASLKEILLSIKKLDQTPPLLFVQNGIGHYSFVKQLGLHQVSFASIEHGAGRENDRLVRHNGIGSFTIAVNEGMERYFSWVDDAESKNFPIRLHKDAEQMLLRKVLINCMINPLTAILQIKNGELIHNPHANMLFRQLYTELLNNFPEMEEDLSYEDAAAVCSRTAENRSSMYVDRLNGQPMEVDTIVSAVLRMIEEREGSAPLLQVLERMLCALNGSDMT